MESERNLVAEAPFWSTSISRIL